MLFGKIIDGFMELNEGGRYAMACWNEIPVHYQKVRLHPFVIMPNHIHGIIEIMMEEQMSGATNSAKGFQNFKSQPNGFHGQLSLSPSFIQHKVKSGNLKNQYQHIVSGSIGAIIRGFEIGVTTFFRKHTEIHNVWQRNYHDTIIRSERSFRNISNYIINNPKNWINDEFNK